MPKKTVRQMSARERRHYSLGSRVFSATLFNCILIGIVALVIGLSFYIWSVTGSMIDKVCNVAKSASISAAHAVDSVSFSEQVMELYRDQSEEERQNTGTTQYRGRFAFLKETHEYDVLVHLLGGFLENNDVYDVYLGMYDRDTSALVFIVDADPNPETQCMPGDWDAVTKSEVEHFLNPKDSERIYDIRKTEKYGLLCTAGVPLKNKNGDITVFVLADITLQNIVDSAKSFVLQFSAGVLAATALIAWFSTLKMKKTVVQPIEAITEAAQNYVSDRKKGETFTDHFAMLNIRTGDEIENLSLVMADMERDIDSYTEDLTAVTAEKARIGSELDMAAKIQASMLPHIFPPYPERKEFDIYASMEPAKEVGGDFYDFFLIDEDRLALVMADVSGKGVPASLFMMITKVIIQSVAMLGNSAEVILNKTNEALCKDNQLEMFVTCWLGILEISTGKLTAVNAGHEYPVIKEPDGDFRLIKDKHGFPLGGFDDEIYEPYQLQLKPGSRLFLYTDGVTEAMDAGRQQFGMERMLESLNRDPEASLERTLSSVRDDIRFFVKDAEQFDDITMLCFEYKG